MSLVNLQFDDGTVEAVDVSALRRELAQASFENFVWLMKCVSGEWMEPLPWFHRKLCAILDDWWRSGARYKILIEMPPGHAKSWYTKLFVCWAMGMDRKTNVAYASYGADLATQQAGDIRQIMESPEYKELFPASALDTRAPSARRKADGSMDRTTNAKGEFAIPNRGGKLVATGVAGPLTGKRIHLGVIDDPDKNAEDARSRAKQEEKFRWYTTTLRTRKDARRPLRIMMLLTRWHMYDLAGRVLEAEGEDWEINPEAWRRVRFQAIKTEQVNDPDDPRENGEALWSEAGFTAEHVEAIRRLDPVSAEALWQQNPIPDKGELFKAEWFNIIERIEAPARSGHFIQSWDLRGGGPEDRGSFAVGELWWRSDEHELAVLVDQVRGRWSPEETFDIMLSVQQRELWARAREKYVEKKADGVSALSLLSKHIPGLVEVKPTESKVTRARGTTHLWAGGNVKLLKGPWNAEYIGEHLTFPQGKNDDQVDCTTQALDKMFGVTQKKKQPSPYAALAAQLKKRGDRDE
jgi:predicted phage terminase large subunit-like protein